MSINNTASFISATVSSPENQWSRTGLDVISAFAVPDLILGGRGFLLRSDIHSLWARWFIEALCDPQRFVDSGSSYAIIFKEVIEQTHKLLVGVPKDERDEFGIQMARLINEEVQRRKNRMRNQPSHETKKYLIDISKPTPHCWICGYRFDVGIVDKFVGLGGSEPALPQFIDYLKPQGLNTRDLGIEVDHVLPVVEGGDDDDNLRLACGWCNAAKGGRTFIYDVSAKPLTANHPSIGPVTLPRRFWVIRTLVIRQRCEWEGGCTKTVMDDQLTIRPMHPSGAMNPTNLRLTCAEHDPIRMNRYVSRTVAEKMWKKKETE